MHHEHRSSLVRALWAVIRSHYAGYSSNPHWASAIRRLLPTPGNVLFTLLLVLGLAWASSAGAFPLGAPSAASSSTGTIAYQGRLADASGNPVTATVPMVFRLYNAATGGTPLWEENWAASNSVQVSDGLFNVMLGSLTAIPQTVVTGNSSLWLGISVNADDEMQPRIQLGSVPFATQALTVPDGSITAAKLAPGITFAPKRLQAKASDSMTIAAGDWTRLNGMEITSTFASGATKAQFCAPLRLNAANSTGWVRLVVDNVPQAVTSFSVSASFVGWHDEVVCLHALTDLTAGSHTIAVDWMTNSSALTVNADRVLIVEQ